MKIEESVTHKLSSESVERPFLASGMPSNFNRVLFGGPVAETLENAQSFGEFCFNRLKRHGDNVLYVSKIKLLSVVVKLFPKKKKSQRSMVTHQKKLPHHNYYWERYV